MSRHPPFLLTLLLALVLVGITLLSRHAAQQNALAATETAVAWADDRLTRRVSLLALSLALPLKQRANLNVVDLAEIDALTLTETTDRTAPALYLLANSADLAATANPAVAWLDKNAHLVEVDGHGDYTLYWVVVIPRHATIGSLPLLVAPTK